MRGDVLLADDLVGAQGVLEVETSAVVAALAVDLVLGLREDPTVFRARLDDEPPARFDQKRVMTITTDPSGSRRPSSAACSPAGYANCSTDTVRSA